MLIILEGPDGVGKSTLAQRIVTRLRERGDAAIALHKGPPTSHPIDEYVAPLYAYRPGHGNHIICDRWHWGERIYPALFNRPTKMDAAVHRWVEMFLQSRAAVVYFLDRDATALAETIARRGDTLVTASQVTKLAYEYDRVFSDSMVRRHHVDMAPYFDHEEALDTLVTRIIADAETYETEVFNQEVSNLITYVGSPHPRTLLVGDVRNRSERQHKLAPAFGPYPSTSGHYLMHSLAQRFTGLDKHYLKNFGIMNGNDVDPLDEALKTLNPERVVALGRQADRTLSDLSVKHGVVPHPQYVRRFHHHQQDWYGRLIARAAAYGEDLSTWRPS